MRLEQVIESDIIIIRIIGRVEYENTGELQDFLKKNIQEVPLPASNRHAVIDFEQTEYLNSVGLGCIINLSKDIRTAGGDLKLAAPNQDLAKLFAVVSLVKNFEIYDSVEAAIKNF